MFPILAAVDVYRQGRYFSFYILKHHQYSFRLFLCVESCMISNKLIIMLAYRKTFLGQMKLTGPVVLVGNTSVTLKGHMMTKPLGGTAE